MSSSPGSTRRRRGHPLRQPRRPHLPSRPQTARHALAPELAEYFVGWQTTADQVEPQLSGQLLKELGGARGTIEAVQERVDTSGGTIRSSAFVQFLSDNQNLLDDLLRFYGSVAQECPAPTP